MKIGTNLTLTNKEPQGNIITKYRCKIVDKNEQYLFIDYPINEDTKRTAVLQKGTKLEVSYIGSDQSVYSFFTQVIAKVNVNIPALAIDTPGKDDIKKIQRRSFVRIETSVDVALYSEEYVTEPVVTVTSDISGGGMLIILPTANSVNRDDSLNVWMVLQMQNRDYHYIQTRSKVIRVITDTNNIHTASIKFENMSSQDQQVLIRYCFEKQRELRTKERI